MERPSAEGLSSAGERPEAVARSSAERPEATVFFRRQHSFPQQRGLGGREAFGGGEAFSAGAVFGGGVVSAAQSRQRSRIFSAVLAVAAVDPKASLRTAVSTGAPEPGEIEAR